MCRMLTLPALFLGFCDNSFGFRFAGTALDLLDQRWTDMFELGLSHATGFAQGVNCQQILWRITLEKR